MDSNKIIAGSVVAATIIAAVGVVGYHCTPHRTVDNERIVRVEDYNVFEDDTTFMKLTNTITGKKAYHFSNGEMACIDGKVSSGYVSTPDGLAHGVAVHEEANGKIDSVHVNGKYESCSDSANKDLCQRCGDYLNEKRLEYSL